MSASLRLSRDNDASVQIQRNHLAVAQRSFRRCETGLARYADCLSYERRSFLKIPETRQARCQARHGGQTIRFYEMKAGSAHADNPQMYLRNLRT